MKFKLFTALILMILCAGAALAAGGKCFIYDVPDGIVCDMNITSTVLTCTVDTEASDFAEALLSSGDGLACARYGFHAPENARYLIDFNGNGYSTDREFNSYFSGMEKEDMYTPVEDCTDQTDEGLAYTFGLLFGEFEPGINMIRLMPCDDNYSLVRWYDADYRQIRQDKILVKLSFTTDDDAVELDRNILTLEEDLFPNAECLYGIKYEARNGCVDYTVDPEEVPQDEDFIYTKVRAPEGAADCSLSLIQGSDYPQSEAIQDGWVTIKLRCVYTEGSQIHVDECDNIYRIQWMDSRGNVISDTFLQINVHPELFPGSCYVEDWTPVPAERLIVDDEALGDASYCEYSEVLGKLQFYFDAYCPADQLQNAQELLYVAPPEGAVSYRINHSGGSNFYGEDSYLQKEQDAFIKQNRVQALTASQPNAVVYERNLYTVIHQTDLVQIYQPVCETKPGYGSLYLIYWYDNASGRGDPICMEYINEVGDPMVFTDIIDPVESEDELETVDFPTLVYDGEACLHVDYYPQTGSGCCFEIGLYTFGGVPMHGQRVCIYLPYPEGGSYHDRFEYFVRHYNDDYTQYTMESAVKTAKGIRIFVDSFSPFVCGQGDMLPYPENSLVIPADTVRIEAEAFMGVSEIENLFIPAGCEEIGDAAFKNCANLAYVEVPESTAIADNAFEGCSKALEIVYIPDAEE